MRATTQDDLSCRELVELVTDYLEGALPRAEHERFEAHVAGCPGCGAYVRQMRATVRALGATAELEHRPEVRGLLQVFRDWKRTAPVNPDV